MNKKLKNLCVVGGIVVAFIVGLLLPRPFDPYRYAINAVNQKVAITSRVEYEIYDLEEKENDSEWFDRYYTFKIDVKGEYVRKYKFYMGLSKVKGEWIISYSAGRQFE